jgi:voltage-gated potassium channel
VRLPASPGWGFIAAIASAVTVAALGLVLCGGTLTWLLERGRADANLRSLPDSLWWAVTTLTTVGYGDYYPSLSQAAGSR